MQVCIGCQQLIYVSLPAKLLVCQQTDTFYYHKVSYRFNVDLN